MKQLPSSAMCATAEGALGLLLRVSVVQRTLRHPRALGTNHSNRALRREKHVEARLQR